MYSDLSWELPGIFEIIRVINKYQGYGLFYIRSY